MTRFAVSVAVVLAVLAGLFWFGDQPQRRYENSSCQYRMIYNYQPEQPMGLLTLGGSRVRVATSATHMDKILAKLRPGAIPVHNLSHSIYTLEKEFVLLRDMLEQHSPKAALVMIEPRRSDFGSAHPDFVEIARLSDIPLTVRALWPESPLNAIRAARDILLKHLQVFDRVEPADAKETVRNCHGMDWRLDVQALDQAALHYVEASQETLDWDLSAPSEEGFRRWMDAYRDLSRTSGTQIIFLLMTATDESLPPEGFEDEFEQATGLRLITLDRQIHEALSRDGKRDRAHLNEAGREIFLPWLITRIEEKCTHNNGCM